ncbi:MAG: hypothetical protein M3Q10_08355 [Chloroflexota bacterium]|nr:hypothetical protein [Chloroflexota bacterium]
MTTEAPTTAKATWMDWAGPDEPEPAELLTRDELIERLRDEGFVVDREDLRNWQSTGTIPYGINRWDGTATRTFYAPWMLAVVRTLRVMQADGRKMAEIRAHLRDLFDRRRSASKAGRIRSASAAAVATATATAAATVVRSSSDTAAVRATEATAVERFPAVPPDLAGRLVAFSRDAERATGGRIVRAEVRLVDEEGRPLVFRFDTRPPPDE